MGCAAWARRDGEGRAGPYRAGPYRGTEGVGSLRGGRGVGSLRGGLGVGGLVGERWERGCAGAWCAPGEGEAVSGGCGAAFPSERLLLL